LKLFRYKPDVNRFASIEVGDDSISEVLTVVDRFNEGTPLAADEISRRWSAESLDLRFQAGLPGG